MQSYAHAYWCNTAHMYRFTCNPNKIVIYFLDVEFFMHTGEHLKLCVCLHVHGGVSSPRGKRSGFWNHGGVFPDHQLDFNCPMFFTCTICMWDSDSPSKSK